LFVVADKFNIGKVGCDFGEVANVFIVFGLIYFMSSIFTWLLVRRVEENFAIRKELTWSFIALYAMFIGWVCFLKVPVLYSFVVSFNLAPIHVMLLGSW